MAQSFTSINISNMDLGLCIITILFTLTILSWLHRILLPHYVHIAFLRAIEVGRARIF